MKRFAFSVIALMVVASSTLAAPLGRATADFDNLKPQKQETAWGRLVADAIRTSAKADIALMNAGALKPGTLPAGEVTDAQIVALLAFPNDEVVTITITGAQLRAALERAVHAYPTGSTAFLHGSGYRATFNTQAPTNNRLTMLRINEREVQNSDSIRVAMPSPLAQGGSGYFTIWTSENSARSNASMLAAVRDWVRAQGKVSPDAEPRLAPQ